MTTTDAVPPVGVDPRVRPSLHAEPLPSVHAEPVGAPRVTIVVPTFNRRDSLRRLLETLQHQSVPRAWFEVIVVDDGSTDGSPDLARSLDVSYPLRVVTQPNAGPGAARNRGVQEARGEIVLFLDDDVAPRPRLIAEHLALHDSHPNAVVIGPMLPPDGWARPAWIRWEEDKLLRQYHAMQAGRWECTARQFYTGNASLRRARFLAAGGFDSRFKRAEDVELAYRLRDHGVRFIFAPRADVLHYASRTFASWRRTPYQYGRYDVLMEREGGQGTLGNATREFHTRHPLNRALARLCVGRPALLNGAVALLAGAAVAADRLRRYRAASFALSAIFQLLYWQGVCDELGGATRLWSAVDAAAPRLAPLPVAGDL